jgi:hypothetical protein
VGLRGGSYEIRGPFYRWDRPLVLTFHEARFVSDVAVSGKVVWHRRSAVAIGHLRVLGPGASGTLLVEFPTDRAGDVTTVRGTLDGRLVVLETLRAWTS